MKPKLKKRLFWLLLFAMSIASGLFSYRTLPSPNDVTPPLFLPIVFVANVALLGWCYADAEDHRVLVGRWLTVAILLLGFLAVPFAVIRTRGWVRGLRFGYGFPLFLVAVAGALIGDVVALLIVRG